MAIQTLVLLGEAVATCRCVASLIHAEHIFAGVLIFFVVIFLLLLAIGYALVKRFEGRWPK